MCNTCMLLYRKRSDTMKKRVTFTLEETTIDKLKEYSDATMVPQARIVEQAILEYLEKMKSTEK